MSRLEELRALAEAATPGPWKLERGELGFMDIFDAEVREDIALDVDPDNAAFIAAAREAVPALLAVATAALAREAAETALAAHDAKHDAAVRDTKTLWQWKQDLDRLTAERALAVEALRAALATISGEEGK